MSKSILFIIICLLASCALKDSRFVRKTINNNDIVIKWFYYSYITNNSPDFIVVIKGSEEKEIYKATGIIVDVALIDSTIVLKLVEPFRSNMEETSKIDSTVFGYEVVIDSNVTHSQIWERPKGIKE